MTQTPVKASTDQIRCISTMLRKLGLDEHKASIISGATDGRTESRGDLQRTEATDLIKYLKGLDPDEVSAEKMRRKIISRAHEMGWRMPGTLRVDMKRLDDWCGKFGYRHKHLNSYTLAELPALVTQFDAVYTSFLKSL
jgi:hypothetical protein